MGNGHTNTRPRTTGSSWGLREYATAYALVFPKETLDKFEIPGFSFFCIMGERGGGDVVVLVLVFRNAHCRYSSPSTRHRRNVLRRRGE